MNRPMRKPGFVYAETYPRTTAFYPCDREGNEMEPVEGWEELYVCTSCGRIIHQTTLEVGGRNPYPIQLQ